jgi:hypothetical protein
MKSDTRELEALADMWIKDAPRQTRYAVAAVLNTLAFKTKPEIFNQASRTMKIRAARFISSSILVDKARGAMPIAMQQSEVGTVHRPRYTGWIEQHGQGRTRQTHTFSKEARASGGKGKVSNKYRFKAGKKFESPARMQQPPGWRRTMSFLRHLETQGKTRQPFKILKQDLTRGIRTPGVYMIKNKRSKTLTFIASFEAKQPGADMVILRARNVVLAKFDFRDTWNRQFLRQLQRKYRQRK